jgi:glycosyltransferase involved in cell wall biosynthesis
LKADNALAHRLVILGKASYGSEPLLDQVRSFGLETEVVFTGYVQEEDMAAIYSLADLLAFPSLHEGFGIPILEAMACRVPIVTSRTSALPEIAGPAAVLVDPFSVSSIEEGIRRVLHDEELRSHLVHQGTERIREFDVGKAAVATVEAYGKAIALESS